MSPTLVLINMIGAVALLLWAMRMVRTGMTRAFGSSLRRFLGRYLTNRFGALLAGLGVTTLLQSSTATGLMTASFAGRGFLVTAPALAVMLGADIGTTLIAQLFSLKITWLSPILIIIGLVAFQSGNRKRTRDFGRLSVGLGLMLLALQMLVADTQPIRESPVMLQLVESLGGAPLVAIVVAAVITWLAHSSLAMVLLICSLTGIGAIPIALVFPLVLGANLGGTIPAITATLGSAPAARRVALGNAFFRLVGCLALLPLLRWVPDFIAMIESDPVRQVVNFHTAFNLGLAVVFIGFVGPVSALLERLLPDGPAPADEGQARYLDKGALAEPAVALANARRETLRIADVLDEMLAKSMEALRRDDREYLAVVSNTDDIVDRLFEQTKLYLTEVSRHELGEEESRQCSDIMAFATNLEHIGDIIDKNLVELAAKKIKYRLHFSEEGLREIEAMHRRVHDNLKLATSVFVSGDRKLARKLLLEKEHFRSLERNAAESHHERLKVGKRESIETSSLHLDILRDLKRINSHLTSVAYPILEQAGELRASRLRERAREPVVEQPILRPS
jgi:phosphate:Na+ symporter